MSAQDPVALVELHIACRSLLNKDFLSKSDPIVSVQMQVAGQWVEQGRTEWIKDCLNPRFVTAVRLAYHFESIQHVKFLVYDIDDLGAPLSSQDFLGEATTTLADIVTARGALWTAPLQAPGSAKRSRGQIEVVSEEVRELNQEITLVLEGRGLDRKDFFGSSDPFVVVSQQLADRAVPVAQTEVIKNTLNPRWRPLVVSAQRLCNGDPDRELVVECWDWNRSGSHEIIGTARTRLRELASPDARATLELVNERKRGKKGYRNSGVLAVVSCAVRRIPTFTEYLRGGLEVSLVAAIDFTASNGNPAVPESLHYGDANRMSAYAQAISAVGEILAYYDRDKMFPVYGFGAMLPPQGQVSHCFALNGNPQNPEVPGVAGILEAYRKALATVTLYGPTLFSHVLQATNYIAQTASAQSQAGSKYFVLLIITDGVINDMDATVDQIVAAANNLPLSIVIVGVGSADFGNMEALDADDRPLRARDGAVARRDIVQFVPFDRFKGSYQHLAQETLAEIPGQCGDDDDDEAPRFSASGDANCTVPGARPPLLSSSDAETMLAVSLSLGKEVEQAAAEPESPFAVSCPYEGCGRRLEAAAFVVHALRGHRGERQGYACPVCALAGAPAYSVTPTTDLGAHLATAHADMVRNLEDAQQQHLAAVGKAAALRPGSIDWLAPTARAESRLEGPRGECTICLEEMRAGDEVTTLECFCVFHSGCLAKWWAKDRSCPTHKAWSGGDS
eukprot:m51a1_g9112 hypothetical protein (734) ;mRNA; r:115041-117983